MPKKTKEAPAKITLIRRVIAKGEERDLCGEGPGVLYKDEIEYTNDKPGKFEEATLAARVVVDTQDLLEQLFEVQVDVKR
jgi:hypothetical protein